MGSNLRQPSRPDKAPHASGIAFRGDISRRVGNIRAATLDGRDIVFGTAAAAGESAKNPVWAAHDVQLGADRKCYELKDDIIIAFGKNKNASSDEA